MKTEEFPLSVKALAEKGIERIFESQPAKHEVVIKFSRAQKKLVVELLKEHRFGKVSIVRREGKDYFVYCQFAGDMQELDRQLKLLRSKALLSCGEEENGKSSILEFFVDFKELLAGSSPLMQQAEKKRRILFLSVVALSMAVLLIMIAPKVLRQIKTKPVSVLNPRLIKSSPVYPAWNKFILPRHQQGWAELKKEFSLDESTMLEIFRKIKSTSYSGYSGIAKDLTLYPEIIKRALSMIILKDVKDVEELQKLGEDLKGKFVHGQPFPDQSERHYINVLDSRQSENMIVLSFYEHITKDPSFASFLINKIKKGM